MTGHTGGARAVATAVLPDGRTVAVTGDRDATVRVWDLATGTPAGHPMTGHTHAVYAVATAALPDGRVVAVTGSLDETVRVWDLATGTLVGDPLPEPDCALAVFGLAGPGVVVACGQVVASVHIRPSPRQVG
jgi:WD40 repeat protein